MTMRPLTPLALALLAGIGLAACNADENAANVPADEPAATGSVPAPDTPPEPDPAMPPAESDTAQ
jgi:hypothetical protein